MSASSVGATVNGGVGLSHSQLSSLLSLDNKENDIAVAFAFDIDGVLVKGKEPIPGAREAIEMLQRKNIPFIFLTNGGGMTEQAHTERLGMRLELTLDLAQFVQSHSPFQDLVPLYQDRTILILEHHQQYGQKPAGGQDVGIAAILIWSSPRDWLLDLQVTMDLLLSSGGKLGKHSAHNGDASFPNNGYLQDGQPQLYFCNCDFLWATPHDQPRFAQGAFQQALRGVWSRATDGATLDFNVCGKPTERTYAYGERVLLSYNEKLNQQLDSKRKIRTVYMIGDNPASDICGANAFRSPTGVDWKSILVESGVYEAGSTPQYSPTFLCSGCQGSRCKGDDAGGS
ncbi:HAD-like domain-containing protein [Xylariaceae sp. FL1272]|nr:HAD-like domain-containing protein [Xylariaceae sp. FL1272]